MFSRLHRSSLRQISYLQSKKQRDRNLVMNKTLDKGVFQKITELSEIRLQFTEFSLRVL